MWYINQHTEPLSQTSNSKKTQPRWCELNKTKKDNKKTKETKKQEEHKKREKEEEEERKTENFESMSFREQSGLKIL